MNNSPVTLDVQDGIATVTLNRPDKHNALNMAMFTAIDTTITSLKRNRQVRVVIVKGAGESFCSGLDIKSVMSNPRSALRLLWKWLPGNANLAQRVSVGWRALKVPVIMSLHGKCWGGGMQIALGGDYRIVSSACSLSVMEARWGLVPDMGGTPGLRECVGADQAMKLAMTAEPVLADEALQCGLVTEVAEDPHARALELAHQLVARSPDTNRAIKSMYHGFWCGQQRRILASETINQIKMLLGANQRIAVKRAMGNTDISYK